MDLLMTLAGYAAVLLGLWALLNICRKALKLAGHFLFPPKPKVWPDGWYLVEYKEEYLFNGGVVVHITEKNTGDYTLTLMPDYDTSLKPTYWEKGPMGLWDVPVQMEHLPAHHLAGNEVEIFFPPHLHVSDITLHAHEGGRVTYHVQFKRNPSLLPQYGYSKVVATGHI